MSDDTYTCPECGDSVDQSVCHCGEGPNGPSHYGEGSHHFTPYNHCRCAAIREKVREEFAATLATIRAETALAEREACAVVLDKRAEQLQDEIKNVLRHTNEYTDWDATNDWLRSRRADVKEAMSMAAAIRARTTLATLSADTLVTIAETRGMRLSDR